MERLWRRGGLWDSAAVIARDLLTDPQKCELIECSNLIIGVLQAKLYTCIKHADNQDKQLIIFTWLSGMYLLMPNGVCERSIVFNVHSLKIFSETIKEKKILRNSASFETLT